MMTKLEKSTGLSHDTADLEGLPRSSGGLSDQGKYTNDAARSALTHTQNKLINRDVT